MKNLVRQMLCEIKREAFEKVYKKENFEEEDEEGNSWPKVEELIAVKPKDSATVAAWRALCMYWSIPSFRKMSTRGKENRLVGGNTVYHHSGSRGLVATQQFLKTKNGVDPGQAGAWHHQHRMEHDGARGLCCEKTAIFWAKYDNAMTEKYGEDWQAENLDIDHAVVHDISSLPHGRFAMGDSVISPNDVDSIKYRKRSHPNSQTSGESSTRTSLWQMELTPEWRAGVERVLQALAEKIGMDISGLMQPDLQAGTEWCDGVERALKAMADIIPIDIRALFCNKPPRKHAD